MGGSFVASSARAPFQPWLDGTGVMPGSTSCWLFANHQSISVSNIFLQLGKGRSLAKNAGNLRQSTH